MLLSLVVSITVIPAAWARWMRAAKGSEAAKHSRTGRVGSSPDYSCGMLINRGSDMVYWMMTGWRAWTPRPRSSW
ncbi:MAG: hypothetical protein R3B49_05825 [Phycisphaerales bacterium]